MNCLARIPLLAGIVLVAAAPAPQGVEGVEAALAAYRAGRYDEAQPVLARALERLGAAAPVELRLNAALASLRLLRSRDAELALAPLAADGADAGGRDAEVAFLLGLAAFQHGERALGASRLADAEPMAHALALRSFDAALVHFRRAAGLVHEGSAIDAEAAWRNAERAVRLRAEAVREREQKPADPKQAEPAPPPPPPEPPKPPDDASGADAERQRLSPAELRRIAELVEQRRQRKIVQRQEGGAGVVGRPATERDW
jgi:tetratricopeptide (TPR) repeat protein